MLRNYWGNFKLELSLQLATSVEHELVITMMQEYYALDGLDYNKAVSQAVLTLLNHPEWGQVNLLQQDQVTIGYAVLTYGFSLEFKGRSALLDEIYLRPDYRGKGLGTQVIESLASYCQQNGFNSLRLEVEHENTVAHNLYLRQDFMDHERYLMTRWLI